MSEPRSAFYYFCWTTIVINLFIYCAIPFIPLRSLSIHCSFAVLNIRNTRQILFSRKFMAWNKIQEIKEIRMLHAVFYPKQNLHQRNYSFPSFSCLQVVKGATLFSAAVTWGQFLILKPRKEKIRRQDDRCSCTINSVFICLLMPSARQK